MPFLKPKEDKSLIHQKQIESRRIIRTLSIGLGLILILLVGYFVSQNIENNTQKELRETLLLENELGDLLSKVQDAETAQRGFLLTSEEEYLEPYYIAINQTPQILRNVLNHPQTEPQNVTTLEKIVQDKFGELTTTVNYQKNNQPEKALALVKSGKGKGLMDKITDKISELKKISYESLKENRQEIALINKIILAIQIIATIAMFFVFYNIYSILRPLIQNLENSNIELANRKEILQEKNEQLERFAYIASHDLNEPLRTITSMITILEEDYRDKFDEEAKQNFKFITSAVERMKNMIDGILNYSRIGKSSEQLEQVELNVLLHNLKKDLSLLIEQKQATIVYDRLPTIEGFKLELRQLFQNLITNALKFSKIDTAPIIEIEVKESTLKWQFAIKDNGIGIEEENQEKIFGIFAKLHRNSEYEGQGIGLAFCRKIVSLHRGKIRVVSKLGEGSTFYFTISKNINSNSNQIDYEN